MLRSILDAADGGRGGLAHISGEAGVGKTRLADEAASHARKMGFEVLRGRCLFLTGGRPYLPFLESIRLYKERKSEVRTSPTGNLPMGLMGIEDEPGERPDRSQERESLFEGVASFFEGLSTRSGVLFILEDTHLADASTLSLLLYILKGMADHRMAIIATCRTENLRAPSCGNTSLTDLVARITTDPLTHVLELGNLGREESGFMMASR
jgi:predicted ATPase